MGSLNLKTNVIVFASTLEEHKARLLQVLQYLRKNGLNLPPSKWVKFFFPKFCVLFRPHSFQQRCRDRP